MSYDTYDSSETNNVVLIYNSFDDEGNRTCRIERKIWGEECETLSKLLTEMTYFLNGMTFTYVDGLVAMNDGEDVAMSE